MTLKSADHVAAILELINADGATWATDAIWARHKDDTDYKEVALPDRSYRQGGFIVVEQGRKDYVSTGVKLHADEAAFWAYTKKHYSHWPRPPFKKSAWTRDYRRKSGDVIIRRFDLFAHYIHAITNEVDGKITVIEFFAKRNWDDATQSYPEESIFLWNAE